MDVDEISLCFWGGVDPLLMMPIFLTLPFCLGIFYLSGQRKV